MAYRGLRGEKIVQVFRGRLAKVEETGDCASD